MDEKIVFGKIQAQIGYPFKNLDLLRQALTRRSYSEENGGENNEVLEFIGDKALDLAVIRLLVERFGKINNADGLKEFSCDYKEGNLTEIKSRMVRKEYLAQRIDELDFAADIRMGKGDIKNHIGERSSVKEDLFEAIVGAVALDCNWDLEKITSAVEAMIIVADFLQEDTNYVRKIQEWEEQVNHVLPWFWFEEHSLYSLVDDDFEGVSQNFPINIPSSEYKIICKLKVLDRFPIFRGFGRSKSEARMNVCKLAYEQLCKEGEIKEITIQDEIENPNRNDAINQLEILARRGYFSIPKYEFSQSYDKDGNPIWKVVCKIKEKEKQFSATASTKANAKKSAAWKMLKWVLEK